MHHNLFCHLPESHNKIKVSENNKQIKLPNHNIRPVRTNRIKVCSSVNGSLVMYLQKSLVSLCNAEVHW